MDEKLKHEKVRRRASGRAASRRLAGHPQPASPVPASEAATDVARPRRIGLGLVDMTRSPSLYDFAESILREHGAHIGMAPDFQRIDDDEALAILSNVASHRPFARQKLPPLEDLFHVFDRRWQNCTQLEKEMPRAFRRGGRLGNLLVLLDEAFEDARLRSGRLTRTDILLFADIIADDLCEYDLIEFQQPSYFIGRSTDGLTPLEGMFIERFADVEITTCRVRPPAVGSGGRGPAAQEA